MAVAAYLALGVVVLASRLVFPKAKTAIPGSADGQAVPANDPAKADELPIAA